MSVSDAAIIYLALGAPVAMFRFFQLPRPLGFSGIISVFTAFILWPISTIGMIAASSKSASDASRFVTRKNLDVRIIRQIENLKAEVLSELSKGELESVVSVEAESLERYIGLSLANPSPSFKVEKELFSIAGHPDETVAVRCLARRNSVRLDRHQRQSARDFVSAFEGWFNSSDNSQALLEQLITITELLGDRETTENLKSNYRTHDSGDVAKTRQDGRQWSASAKEISDERQKRAA